MSTQPYGDAEIHLNVVGAGHPVLLLHGFPLSGQMWQEQIGPLSERYQLLIPDLPGFGQSASMPGPFTLKMIVDRLVEVLEHRQLPRPLTLCGLSMGGYLAWEWMTTHRDWVARLILCHTRAAADDEATARARRLAARSVTEQGTADYLSTLTEKLLAPDSLRRTPQLVNRLLDWMREASPSTIAHYLVAMAEREDHRKGLAQIDVPTLVVAGGQDGITSAAEMKAMTEQIPHAQWELITDSGHLSPLESPDSFNRAVLQFLQATDSVLDQ